MIECKYKSLYKKELRLILRRGKNHRKLLHVLELMTDNANKGIDYNKLLPEKYRLHKLQGIYNGLWECHIESDWLLIFDINEHSITLERTGSHSDLFDKIRR
jgi:mRNA interferase YafQ